MVTSENKERDPPMPLYHEHPNTKVHRPQPMVWYRPEHSPVLSKFPGGDKSGIGYTYNSAFQPVSTCDRTRPRPVVLKYNPAAEENTQVTWCCSTGASYRCSIAVTGTERLWGLHPRNHWRHSSDDTSHCSKEYEEDEDEIDVGDYETNTSPNSTLDDGSICLSPFDSSTKLINPVGRLKTVISAPITITSGSTRDFSMTECVAQNARPVAQESKQIHTRPIYISERAGSQPPPNTIFTCAKTDCNRGTSLPEDASLLRKEDIPLLMRTGNGRECWLSYIASPLKIGKHFPSEYVTAARLAEDDVFIKTEGSLVRTRACCITEHELRTPAVSATRSSEDIKADSFTADSSFNEKSFYKKKDDVEQNTFSYITEEKVLKKTAQSPVVKVKDVIRECPTVKTAGDNCFSGNEINHSQTIRSGTYEHGIKPTVMETNFPRDTSTPVNVHGADTSILVESSHSKLFCERQSDQESFIIKCQENGDKQSLCEQQSSPMFRSTKRNHTQIYGKQSFEETGSSTQKSYSNECKTQMDSDQSSEDRGEFPRKIFHLKNHINDEIKQRLVDRRDLPHEGSPVETHNAVAYENIFEYGRDYTQRKSPVMKLIQVGDQQHLGDKGGFLQSTFSMGTYIQIREEQEYKNHSSYAGQSSLSETHIKIGEKQCLENEVVGTERNSPLENETLITDQQRPQGRGVSPLNKVTQRAAQRILDDQSIPLQRSTVLVQSRELRPGGGETVIQHVGTASGTKLSTGVQGSPLFCAEDTALRSRVLVLLWVLLGERRLCEVGFPVEPVHRILWRVVDVCCSVAGVKSAAAVPLNADHDCGLDMLCFRDHTHRFLEVCAPTREHWKQFGWASLTVDAVVRKIYDEELVRLLRLQVLPPAIQQAVSQLSQADRSPHAQHTPGGGTVAGKLQTAVVVPAKKKRGRPAKISHKVDEGGRIERVMLWRFLLNLLEDPRNSPCIHWVQRDEGIFRILNTDWLARLWGRRHGNPRMTYEKMARAMRTYYRSKVLQPVPRLRNLPRKLVYKFNPAVIHKVAAMKLSCSTFSGRGLNYNTNNSK